MNGTRGAIAAACTDAFDALCLLEDELDAVSSGDELLSIVIDDAGATLVAELLLRLVRRWDHDTLRKIRRALEAAGIEVPS